MFDCLAIIQCLTSNLDCNRTGQDHTRTWMESKCKFVVTEESMASALREYTSFVTKITEDGGGQV